MLNNKELHKRYKEKSAERAANAKANYEKWINAGAPWARRAKELVHDMTLQANTGDFPRVQSSPLDEPQQNTLLVYFLKQMGFKVVQHADMTIEITLKGKE